MSDDGEPFAPPAIITSDVLYDLFKRALVGRTVAGGNVFTPRDITTNPDNMPIIKINSPEERKESLGPNAPQYNVFTTIRVVGTLQSLAQANDQAADAAQGALGVWQRQVERAIINNYDLYRCIEQIESVDTKNQVNSSTENTIGEMTMDFVCKFYQGTDAFAPYDVSPIAEVAIYMDLLNIYDPNGTYTPPFDYPVPGAPRASGPDGRIEAGAVIDIPQE